MSSESRSVAGGQSAAGGGGALNYGSSLPNSTSGTETGRRCYTGIAFIKSLNGILNIITIVALVCVLISAGVANKDNCKEADHSSYPTSVKVSAYSTRNAVLAFAVIGLILIILDTVLHVTGIIKRFPVIFDLIFIIIMLVLAGVFFILGCCAAAWEKKMHDTVGRQGIYVKKGAAGAASFFLFVATIVVVINFVLRLIRPVGRNINT